MADILISLTASRIDTDVLSPAIKIDQSISLTSSSIDTDVLSPTIRLGQEILLTSSRIDTDVLSPTIRIDQSVSLTSSSIDTDVLSPNIETTTDIYPLISEIVLDTLTPILSSNNLLPLTASRFDTDILSPTIRTDRSVSLTTSRIDTDVLSPTVQIDYLASLTASRVDTDILSPTIQMDCIVSLTASRVDTDILSPTIRTDRSVSLTASRFDTDVLSPNIETAIDIYPLISEIVLDVLSPAIIVSYNEYLGLFEYGGVSSNYYNIIAKSINRTMLPEMRKREIKIPGRHVSWDFYQNKFNNRLIEVQLAFKSSSIETLRTNVRDIAKWLYTYTGTKTLRFYDEYDKWYNARVFSQINLETLQKFGQTNVIFECEPYAYATATGTCSFAWSASNSISFVNYAQNTPFTITISGSVTNPRLDHTETGLYILISTAISSQILTINTDTQTIEINGTNYMHKFSGGFFDLVTGTNTFTFTGTSANAYVTFDWNHRWL